MKYGPWFWFLARLGVGVLFAYAGFSKLMEPNENFHAVVLQYEVIPYEWTGMISLGMPWLELTFGVFLILGFATRISSGVLAILALGFVALISLSYLKLGSLPENCGCFGQGGIQLSPFQIILLDFTSAVICLKLLMTHEHHLSLDSWLRRS